MGGVALIPARCGSKSIPFKNIKLFCGKPLIYWSIKACVDSRQFDKIIVATDCDEIARIVGELEMPLVEVYYRKAENASDSASTESVMFEVIDQYNLDVQMIFTLVQLTNPFITSTHLEEGVKEFISSGKSVISCARIKRFFWNENGQPINYDYFNRPRRQEFKGVLIENGAFYVNSVGAIKKFENRLSDQVQVYEMPEYTYVEIDEEEDWISAEAIMRRHLPLETKETIKVVFSDVDGVLTDAGMYYSENGDELKKFNTLDGMGFQLLREAGYKVGIITSEDTRLVTKRAQKLKVDYLFQGAKKKLEIIKDFCEKEGFKLAEIAYIGDDVNCKELLSNVGYAACPSNATSFIKSIPNIDLLPIAGGQGAFRYFAERILERSK